MGGKPKASDKKASAAEQAQTTVAANKKMFFLENYDPLNLAELDDALTDSVKVTARGKANADVMQATTQDTNFREVSNTSDNASANASALIGQLGMANEAADKFQKKRAAAAIGVAQGQSADNDGAMQTLANIGNSEVIAKAKNRRAENKALVNAGLKIAGAGADGAVKKWGSEKFQGQYAAAKDAYGSANKTT